MQVLSSPVMLTMRSFSFCSKSAMLLAACRQSRTAISKSIGERKKPKAPSKKRVPAKKVVERFAENDPSVKEKKMIPATHVDLDSLGETERKIYEAMSPDVPVVADDSPVSGIGMGDLMAALTMLELAGAVECGAGGYYLRRSTDTPSADEEE